MMPVYPCVPARFMENIHQSTLLQPPVEIIFQHKAILILTMQLNQTMNKLNILRRHPTPT